MDDAHYTLRQARSRPLFAVLVVAVIALGTGATAAVFSMTDAVLFRALPMQEPERVLRLYRVDRTGRPSGNMNFPAYADLRDNARSFSHIAAFNNWAPFNLAVAGSAPVRVSGGIVTGDYFNLFGVAPLLGRYLLPADDERRGGHPVAVLSERAWRAHFNADPGIVGTEVIVNTHPFSVVGVMPARFTGPDVAGSVDVWVPMAMLEAALQYPWDTLEHRGRSWHDAVVRLMPGVSRAAAQAEIDGIVAAVLEQTGGNPEFMRLGLIPASEAAIDAWGRRGTRRNAMLLLGVTGALLAIAVSGMANLLLARTEGRGRELAVRLGIGATRGRVLRMLSVESFAYALTGTALGLLLAWAMVSTTLPWLRTIIHVGPTDPALLIHWRVFAVALALAVGAALAAVVSPALRVMRIDLNQALKQGGGRDTKRGSRARTALIVGQVGLSVGLLTIALLLVRSFWHTAVVDPGFDLRNTLVASVDLLRQGYAPERATALQQALVERLEAHPAVASAAFTTAVPLSGNSMVARFERVGTEGDFQNSAFNAVSPGFFETLRIPLQQGRPLTAADSADAPRVVVVNQAFADRYLDGDRQLGERLSMGQQQWEIVGIAADIRFHSLRKEPEPMIWIPLAQRPDGNASIVMRGHTDEPWLLLPLLRTTTDALDANVPIFQARTLASQVGDSYRQATAMAGLLSAFAAIATVLSAAGLHGLLAWQVRTRTREIGIRIALGARAHAVRRHFLLRGAALAAFGIPVGLLAAAWTGRALDAFLYGVTPHDPVTLAAVAAAFLLIALAASWIPARRSSQVDPMVSLRDE